MNDAPQPSQKPEPAAKKKPEPTAAAGNPETSGPEKRASAPSRKPEPAASAASLETGGPEKKASAASQEPEPAASAASPETGGPEKKASAPSQKSEPVAAAGNPETGSPANKAPTQESEPTAAPESPETGGPEKKTPAQESEPTAAAGSPETGGSEKKAPAQKSEPAAHAGATPESGDSAKKGPEHLTPLILGQQKLPIFIKAAVYMGGLAGALGIKTTDPVRMAELIRNPEQKQAIRDLVRKRSDEEIARQGISVGVKEEEVVATLDEFFTRIETGDGSMATRKIAEGEPPEPGEDGRLEYLFNPNGASLASLGRADRIAASREVHQVREGDVLIVRHPPTSGADGMDVRGESVTPTQHAHDISLETIAGPNTAVAGDKLTAAINGVYREDERSGKVQVVQEVALEEVNAATGDLPKTGVASTNFLIRKGVRRGASALTTENVFVGTLKEPGALDEETRVRARNLIIRGQVGGSPLPSPYLEGEMQGMDEAGQRKLQHQLERSLLEAQEFFAVREIMNRNITAGNILIQDNSFTSSLDAVQDIRIDGNLVGGVTFFGRALRVRGNLGNAEGTATRIRIREEERDDDRVKHVRADIQAQQARIEELGQSLEEHQKLMDRQGKKSEYWALLMRGEKRVPRGPMERRILVVFFQAAKKKQLLETEIAECKRAIADFQRLITEAEEAPEEGATGMSVVVGGTLYPGATIETIGPLQSEDLKAQVRRQGAEKEICTVDDVRRDLANAVKDYLVPRQEQLEERKQAVEKMFEGREKRPDAPTLPNKRFEARVRFASPEASGEQGDKDALDLHRNATIVVYARQPQNFHIKRAWSVSAPVKNVTISIERGEGGCTIRGAVSPAPPTPWQTDPEILNTLDAIRILGQSARDLLLSE